MYSNLADQKRVDFFKEIITELKKNQVSATVIIEDIDKSSKLANSSAKDNFEDVTMMLLERAEMELKKRKRTGVLIFDMPSGGRDDEKKFLWSYFETIASGTKYVKPDHFAINVLSTRSEFIRCLQAADLITSVTLAYISGNKYAEEIFPEIKPLSNNDSGRINGVDIKIYPDEYINLYFWLLGEEYIWRSNDVIPLPLLGFPYEKDPWIP